MRKYEIVIKKDIKIPKLTIAKNRISLKFPVNMSPAERAKIECFTDNIVENVGDVKFTLRGRFGEHGIQLRRKTVIESDSDSTVYFRYDQFGK